jgi:DNA-binding HxlR family transcriptional regulator
LIINEIGNHYAIRFNDLMSELKPISPKTLADMLKELHKEGLVKRESFNEIPPRVDYSLTKDGEFERGNNSCFKVGHFQIYGYRPCIW